MGTGVRAWPLSTTFGRTGPIVAGLLALALVVGVTAWWLWPGSTPETTDAPPPSPLAGAPPALPTEQLWDLTTSGEVTVAPGGYVVLAGESVAVRDLFTGELRWEYQHSESARAHVSLLGADQMVIQFGRSSWQSNPQRAFHIPSGRHLDVAETRAAITASHSEAEAPPLTDACGPELDHTFAADLALWVVLLDCGEHIDVVGLTGTGQLEWRSELPSAAADFAEVTVADIGSGLAVVYASEQTPYRGDDQLFGVDLATGEAGPPAPVGRHFFGSLRRESIIAVPGGFCAWDSGLDVSLGCYDSVTGEQRWYRYKDPISTSETPAALVLAGDTLLLMTDEHPSRWVGYRLADGEPQFDLDRRVPVDPQVVHYGDGVLALTGLNGMHGSMIVVYGHAEAPAASEA